MSASEFTIELIFPLQHDGYWDLSHQVNSLVVVGSKALKTTLMLASCNFTTYKFDSVFLIKCSYSLPLASRSTKSKGIKQP